MHAMAYDSARGRVVLTGGTCSPPAPCDDTWEYDGSAWAEQPAATWPEDRWGHAMTYHSARGRVVLFGGSDFTGPVADTWEYVGL